MGDICAYCGQPTALRNPSGTCDHLYWPDMLTDEAKRANGYTPELVEVWVARNATEGIR